jgi:hypothetical protein
MSFLPFSLTKIKEEIHQGYLGFLLRLLYVASACAALVGDLHSCRFPVRKIIEGICLEYTYSSYQHVLYIPTVFPHKNN